METGAGEGAAKGEQVEEKPAEPEPYELTAPEGFNIPEENLKSFAEAAQKAGLSKEQAEAMLAWHKGQDEAIRKASAIAEQQVIAGWQKEIMDDPEFGGAKYKETIADARRALRFADPDGSLRKLLKDMKADYHPVVVRAVARIGRGMAEDKVVGNPLGRGVADTPLEDRMWPGMKVG